LFEKKEKKSFVTSVDHCVSIGTEEKIRVKTKMDGYN